MPGPKEGMVGMPARSNQGASVPPGNTASGGELPSTSAAAACAAATSGWSAAISEAGSQGSSGSNSYSTCRPGSAARRLSSHASSAAPTSASVMPGSVRRSQANSAEAGSTPKLRPARTMTPGFSVGPRPSSGCGEWASSSSLSMPARSSAICWEALRDGIRSERLECIWVPWTRTRKQLTPRDTRCSPCQSWSQPLGSPIRHASAPCRRGATTFDPNVPPSSSSAVNASIRSPCKRVPEATRAAAANTMAATAAFMSAVPSPYMRPSRISGASGSDVHRLRASPTGLVSRCPFMTGRPPAAAGQAQDQIWPGGIGRKHLPLTQPQPGGVAAQQSDAGTLVGVRRNLAVGRDQLRHQVDQVVAMGVEKRVHGYTTTSSRGCWVRHSQPDSVTSTVSDTPNPPTPGISRLGTR